MRFSLALFPLLCAPALSAQSAAANPSAATPVPPTTMDSPSPDADSQGARFKSTRSQEISDLRAELARMAARLDRLEKEPEEPLVTSPTPPVSTPPASSGTSMPTAESATLTPLAPLASAQPPALAPPVTTSQAPAQPAPAAPVKSSLLSAVPTNLPGGATLNYTFDGYYEFNSNHPLGRVNDLRAYDVLSNAISINQADVIFALDPDVARGRRYGVRLDLQFGQATATLQGNPNNELRPNIYRNIFQAYGTYVVPVGKGLTADFGKWASTIGIEGNYTKDQVNYTRSFYFYFLPFYHEGARASYQINDKLSVNYWVVNSINQSEPLNGYKDELFGFAFTPTKNVTWTSNYYLGQEHADYTPSTNCSNPVQLGLCVKPINNPPNGKTHIIDNYVVWQARPKLYLAGEADYFIQRLWAHAAAGESSAPRHVFSGAAYAQYQISPHGSFAVRGEYFSDRGGLFSGTTQALKEGTATYKYTLGNGLDVFAEFRRDWTNVPYFTTHNVGSPSQHQNTATIGLVWWYGGKQGAW